MESNVGIRLGIGWRVDAGVKVWWRVDPPLRVEGRSSPFVLGTPGAVQDVPSVLR